MMTPKARLRFIQLTLGLAMDKWQKHLSKSGDHWAITLAGHEFKRISENRPDLLAGLAVKKRGNRYRVRLSK